MIRPVTAHDFAAEKARRASAVASDATVLKMLREYADSIEGDGRAHAPAWMREAADRLERALEMANARHDAQPTRGDANGGSGGASDWFGK